MSPIVVVNGIMHSRPHSAEWNSTVMRMKTTMKLPAKAWSMPVTIFFCHATLM